MDVVFRIEANKIEATDEMTYYNHICWKFKTPVFGLTHFYEIYDDVCDTPTYEFGTFEDNQFTNHINGIGDPVDNEKIGVGGVWFEVNIYNPKYIIKI